LLACWEVDEAHEACEDPEKNFYKTTWCGKSSDGSCALKTS